MSNRVVPINEELPLEDDSQNPPHTPPRTPPALPPKSGQKSSRASSKSSHRGRKSQVPKTRKEYIWWALENDPKLNIPIMLMIVVSTTCFVMETAYTGAEYEQFWWVMEMIAVVIFTTEFIVRIGSCPNKLKFLKNFMNMVDLLAILPFYVGLIFGSATAVSAVRAIRLVRVFRILKFGRYSIGIQIFVGAIKNSMVSLSILLFLMIIAVILFASAMFYAEGDNVVSREQWGVDGAFSSIPRGFWWCLVTMTTVGYGDEYPVTPQGKLVATAAMLCGLIILALPISVLGANFNKMVEAYAEDSAGARMQRDGTVDAEELRIWLTEQKSLKKVGKQLTVEGIMQRFDVDKTGELSQLEFSLMVHEETTKEEISALGASTLEISTLIQEATNLTDSLSQRLQNVEACVGNPDDG